MLPRTLLSSSVAVRGAEIVPRYLGPRDEPWLAALIEVFRAYQGLRQHALAERLREPLPLRAPRGSLRVARHVLDHATRVKPCAGGRAEAARAAVFRHAAREPDRATALARAAIELGLDPDAIEEAMFADLRSAARVGPVPADLSPMALAQRANLALASALLHRAQSVRVTAFGNTRALVRHVQLVGLICNATAQGGGVRLDLSGPFALFRHTLIYGRRLASLVPRLAWCDRFEPRRRSRWAWVRVGSRIACGAAIRCRPVASSIASTARSRRALLGTSPGSARTGIWCASPSRCRWAGGA